MEVEVLDAVHDPQPGQRLQLDGRERSDGGVAGQEGIGEAGRQGRREVLDRPTRPGEIQVVEVESRVADVDVVQRRVAMSGPPVQALIGEPGESSLRLGAGSLDQTPAGGAGSSAPITSRTSE